MGVRKEENIFELIYRERGGIVEEHSVKTIEKYFDDETGEFLFEREASKQRVGDETTPITAAKVHGQIAAQLAKAEETERGKRAEAETANANLVKRLEDAEALALATEKAQQTRDEALTTKQAAEQAKATAETERDTLRTERDEMLTRVEDGRALGQAIIAEAEANENVLKPETVEIVRGKL